MKDCVELQTDIDSVAKWCWVNALRINVEKCQYMRLYNKNRLIMGHYAVSNDNLTESFSVKDLGVVIENKIKFTEHIDYVTSKALKVI